MENEIEVLRSGIAEECKQPLERTSEPNQQHLQLSDSSVAADANMSNSFVPTKCFFK